MSLATFHQAVKTAAAKYAPTYGLSPAELEYALLADAHLEGGHGDTAAKGDGGYSVGRFQYNTAGGHGSTLLNQGHTLDEISTDEFQANDWAPILAQQLADVKSQGLTGGDAVAKAIFQAERPAQMYPPQRVAAALAAANTLTGSATKYTYSNPGPPSTGTGSTGGGGGGAPAGTSQSDKAIQLWRDFIKQQPDPNKDPLGWSAWKETVSQLGDIAKVLQSQEGKRDTAFDQDLSSFNSKVTATHYANADALANADYELTRNKYGLDVGTTRAGQQLEASKLLAQWGTPAGKSSFTPNELGSSYADTYKRYGMDPGKPSLVYSGTQSIDPARDASQWDNMLGVGGQLPHAPNFIAPPGAADVPNRNSFADGAGGADVTSGPQSSKGILDIMGALDDAFGPGWRDTMTKAVGPTVTPPSARDDWAQANAPYGQDAGVMNPHRPIDPNNPASIYGGNNATRFLWGDQGYTKPGTGPADSFLGPGAIAANSQPAPISRAILDRMVWR